MRQEGISTKKSAQMEEKVAKIPGYDGVMAGPLGGSSMPLTVRALMGHDWSQKGDISTALC